MKLAEIFVQLPSATAQRLEELLDVVEVPDNPTREQVLEVARTLVIELRDGVDEQTLTLIDQLPQAIVDQLF